MILQSDSVYWFDFLPFAFGIFSLCAIFACVMLKLKIHSAAIFVACTTAAAMLPPIWFPALWRLLGGDDAVTMPIATLPAFHFVELTMQVTVGVLCALTALVYTVAYYVLTIAHRKVSAVRSERVFGYVRAATARWHRSDAVE
jgi:hypothetical protein